MKDRVLIDQGFGVYTIDTGFKRPGLVASHLIIEGGHAAFVDVGVTTKAAVLLEALESMKISPGSVDYIMVTHVHLDHAGAAGVLMQRFPNAMLVVHPSGARHMVDPAKLIAGATAVYGEEEMNRIFGEILPVSSDRLIEVPDLFKLSFQGRELLFLDTPGHARHHYCIVDQASESIFSGDTFGLSYREFDTSKGPYIFPTTTPIQFDPDALHNSIKRITEVQPKRILLTHFGCIEYSDNLATSLHQHIDKFVEIASMYSEEATSRLQRIMEGIKAWLIESLRLHGCELSEDEILTLMQMDIELNAQGLVCWLDKESSN